MPYVRVWIHLIWATKNRLPTITPELRTKLLEHIRGNAKDKGIWLDTVNAVSDHLHALISLKGDQTIAKVVQLLKGESSHWVNQEKLTRFPFEWQDDYIALSMSDSAVDTVRQYILGQEEHHRKKLFSEEYQRFIEDQGPSGGAKAPAED